MPFDPNAHVGDDTATYGFIECPECHVAVLPRYALKHARTHWPDSIQPSPLHIEAILRQKFLLDAYLDYRTKNNPGGV